MRGFRILKRLGFADLAAVAVAGFGYIVMSLWNWVLPAVTGLHPVTWLQAVALLVLSRILFGGLRHHHGGWHWRRRMRERWQHMTPEERERFRDHFGSHHRCGRSDDSAKPASGTAS